AQSGYALEELVGMNLVRDLTVGVSEEGVAHGCDLISQGKIVRRKEQKRRRGGTLYWTEYTLVPFSYRNRPAVLAVHRDVTAQVLAEEEAARHDAVLTAVAFVAEQFLRDASFDETVPVALARLGEAADVSRVYVFQDHRDDQGRLLTSQRYEWTAPGVEPQIENSQLQDLSYVDDGLSRLDEAFARGDLVASLVREFPEAGRVHLAAQQIQAIVVVPIIVRGKRWGFLGFDECRRERAWSSTEIEALRTAAGAFGAAIERGELEGELRARHGELEGLFEVSVAVGSSLDLEGVFAGLYSEIQRLVPCDAFVLALVDSSLKEIRLAFGIEDGARLPELVRPLDPETSLTAWVACEKKPLLIRDAEAERDQLPAAAVQIGKAVRSWLGVPLVVQEKVVGVVSVQSFAPRTYGEDEQRLLTTASVPVASAIHNAKTHAELSSLERKLRAVEDVSRRMQLAPDKATLYSIVLEMTRSVLGHKRCAILEPQGEELVVAAGHDEVAWAHGLRVHVDGKGLTAAAARAQEPVYVPDVGTDQRYVQGNPDTRCELALPLAVGGQVLGVLDVQKDDVDSISVQDRELLKIVAAELAVALAGVEQLTR
ncbi:MAG: GAF domain-containing protein, partial [Candidatus Bipolaricaulota bacterium]